MINRFTLPVLAIPIVFCAHSPINAVAGSLPPIRYNASSGTPPAPCFATFASGQPDVSIVDGSLRLTSAGPEQIGYFVSGNGLVVDFLNGSVTFGAEVKIESCGAGLTTSSGWLRSAYMSSLLDTHGYMVEFQLAPNGVYLTRSFYASIADVDYRFWNMDTTDAFHVYEARILAGNIELSVDGIPRLSFSSLGPILGGSNLGSWWWSDQSGHAFTAGLTLTRRAFLGGTGVSWCPADINCTGTLSVQDIFDFLALYFATNPRADFNASGAVSVQDIFDFLAAYFAGCT